MKKLLLILFLLLNFYTYSKEFHNFSTDDGLSNHVVFSVQQYNKGLMWFSTKTGIDRFDGFKFKHYNLYSAEQLIQYGLRHSKLHTDNYDRLWANNIFDVFLYDKKNDSFAPIFSINDKNIIHDFFVVDSQNFILATDYGLLKYNLHTKKTTSYPHIKSAVYKVARYDDKLIFILLKNGIIILDSKTDEIVSDFLSPSLNKEINKKRITILAIDSSKNIYLGTKGKIWTFSKSSPSLKTSETLNKKFNNCAIRKILTNKIDESIYIGTDGAGIFKIDSKLNLIKSHIFDPNNPASIPDNSISDIFIDNHKRIWITGLGLSYYDPNKLKFQSFQHQHNNSNSLIHNSVRTIVEDFEGKLWIATNFGISILDRDRKNWKHITQVSTENKLKSNKIISLERYDKNTIIAGTYQNGLFLVDKNYQITPFELTKNIDNNRATVHSIFSDNENLWLGGVGLSKINRLNNESKNFPLSYVFSITKNKNGDIITGGHNGINIIHKNSISNYNPAKYKIGSIFCVKVDSKNRLWGASEGQGLVRFIEKDKSFKKYTIDDGLPSNIVYGILEDKKGNLWLSTTNGLSCFNPETEEFKNYSVADGLKIKEFKYGAYAMTSKGEMVFGGINGFILFKPEDINNAKLKTSLIFTELKLFNLPVTPNINNSPLTHVIDETDTLNLAYNQNALTLEFVSVNFTNPLKTAYSWKLEGLDKEWSPKKTDHTATYTNLKPGKYVFKLRSSYNNSPLINSERTLLINISPPFWETYWAYLIYAILIVIFIYFIFRFYHIQISEEHSKDKIKFFINIAHDIRTPLSLIRSPLSIAINKNDCSAETLKTLKTADNNAERLSYIINQLLDFEKADLNKTVPKFTQINAEDTLRSLIESFSPFLEEREINLITNFKQNNTLLRVDKDKFDTIIFNLLSNAVKYSSKGSIIKISTDNVDNNFILKISDNGLGIPKEQQKHIFKRYFRAINAINSNEVGSGIGLMLTKKLIELHKGDITFESEAGKGSIFSVKLPSNTCASTNPIPTITPSPEFHFKTEIKGEYNIEKGLDNDKKPRLLIAEDHLDLSNHLIEHLSNDYKTFTAENGKVALELTKKIFPDIILSDVMMPEMDGNTLCHHIKSNIETSHIPVILLTSLTSNQHKIEGFKTGADAYLEKPFDLELLKTCLNNLLENRKRLKEKFLRNDLSDDSLSPLDKEFIERIIKILEDNLSNPEFSVETLEKEIGMSHAALYRKFKTLIGKTPLDFINQFRLKKAAELLQNGGHNVNEVAYMVGFSEPKYFSTVFKRFFGNNASDYLKK